jgi:hypothetical protein
MVISNIFKISDEGRLWIPYRTSHARHDKKQSSRGLQGRGDLMIVKKQRLLHGACTERSECVRNDKAAAVKKKSPSIPLYKRGNFRHPDSSHSQW